jgi:glutathione S-transferase
MRARLALAVAGCEVELREVSLKAKPAQMLAASPKGTVPVLVLPDSRVIDESLDIMRWALAKHDPHGWLTHEGEEAVALIARNDGPFKQALDRTKYPTRYPDEDVTGARADALSILQDLDQRLVGQSYLLGDNPSLADAASFPFVRQFAQIDRARFEAEALQHLLKWLLRWEQGSIFETVMFRTANWALGDETIVWPQK